MTWWQHALLVILIFALAMYVLYYRLGLDAIDLPF